MKEISFEEKKVIQMDILSTVDKFCLDNSIPYSLACGTMLGAVRHKGYIPWDDDIDIYMLRDDYERFEKLFPALYENKYTFASLNRTPGWHCVYGKVVDDRTVSINTRVNNLSLGINIDVYPIDDVPDKEEDWLKFRNKQRQAVLKVRYKNLTVSGNQSIKYNILLITHKLQVLFKSKKTLLLELNDLIQSNNKKGYLHVFESCQGLMQTKPFPKDLFLQLEQWPFEDRLFWGFKDADAYLKNAYGNYMQLPPESQRKPHHRYATYWK